MTKVEWEKKLQAKGFNVSLENNVLMLRTNSKDEAIKFKKKMVKEYPYSYGIKVIGDGQGEVLQDTEEC